MSKASDWARLHARPSVTARRRGTGVQREEIALDVLDGGECRLTIIRPHQTHFECTVLEPAEALIIARWILDTFAEPKQLTIRAVESAGTV